MGRKGAGKNAAKDGRSLSSQEDASLTGHFISDLPLLCSRRGLTPVHVCKRGSPLKSQFSILVDSEEPDPDLITAIYMRGWLLEAPIVALLSDGLSSCTTLTGIHLWNVGLNPVTLDAIVQLAGEHRIREITLDGNLLTIESMESIVTLIKQKKFEKLSMKNCGIDDQFVQAMSLSLPPNPSLQHLNLSCNKIGNDGCIALATGLRLNRTLLSLSLTCNQIGDSGAIALAQTLSKFHLTHSEIVLQRKLLSLHRRTESQDKKTRALSPLPHNWSPSSSTILAKSKGEKTPIPGNKPKRGEHKKEERLKKDDKTRKGAEVKKGKGIRELKAKKVSDVPQEPSQLISAEVLVNPLLDVSQVETEADGLYLTGNTSLIVLGLAYNEIGDAGMRSFLEALQAQDKHKDLGPGLHRLTLHHNVPKLQGHKLKSTPCKDVLDNIEAILQGRNSEN